jgi:hypothetical protein
MSTPKFLTHRRIELGGVALAILIGGGLAFAQVAASRSVNAAPAPITGAPYFDRGWEVDNAPNSGPAGGTATWDHGWEVDDAVTGQ